MKKALLSLSMLGLLGFGTTSYAADLPSTAAPPVVDAVVGYLVPPVILQIGPTTTYSTINCSEFVKTPEGPWKAVGFEPFGLGFVQGIIPPRAAIKSGGFIYNNIDLYSQLEEQCTASIVKARY